MKKIFTMITVIAMLFCVGCSKEVREEVTENVTETEKTSTENMIQGGKIRVSSRKPDTFNPLATNYESCRELLYLFYDGLFTLDDDFNEKKNLVSEYSMSDDYLTARLKIKGGITFADGSSLTNYDVKYTIDYIRYNGGSFSGCVRNIKNAEISDSGEIVIELYNPEANFASMLTFPIIKDGSPGKMDVPNGTGQFICRKEDVGYTSLVCEKNSSYHLGRPYIDEIEVLYMNTDIKAETSFLSGETDILINPDNTADKSGKGIKIYKGKSNRFEFLGFNSAGNLFSEESARRAIFAACRKASLADEFEEVETAASTPVNPAAYFYAFETDETDIGEVSDILTRDGWKMGGAGVYEKDGKSLKFNIIVNEDDSVRVGIANFLSHWLLNYGISADVEILSYSSYKERLTSGNYDAFIGGCTIGNAANFAFLIGSGGSANVFGYSGGVMDMRIAALAAAEGESLVSEAKKFGKAMAESAPLVGIYFKTTEVAAKKNIVIPKISPTGVYVEAYSWFLV